VARHKRWFARARSRALKKTAVDALALMDTESSRQELAKAATEGDRLLRRLAKARLPQTEAK
jgi:hypothetical protein